MLTIDVLLTLPSKLALRLTAAINVVLPDEPDDRGGAVIDVEGLPVARPRLGSMRLLTATAPA